MKKRLVGIILIVLMLIVQLPEVQALAAKGVQNECDWETEDIVPQGAKQFVRENYANIIKLVSSNAQSFCCVERELTKAYLGTPFVICELDAAEQVEVYHFPVISGKRVILLISVIGSEGGWNLSVSNDFVEELNEIEYVQHSNEYIFYQVNNVTYAETYREVISFSGEKLEGDFAECSFEEKKYIIFERIAAFKKLDYQKVKQKAEKKDILYRTYVPSFSVDEATYKKFELVNAKGQGQYGMCWAAASATTLNYVKGTNYEPMEICNSQGIGYNQGAGPMDILMALYNRDLLYTNTSGQISWDRIVNNITLKYPIILAAADTANNGEGHVVTICGYRTIMSYKYLMIWDSLESNGAGGMKIITYNSSGTTFTTMGHVFSWISTLSYE